MEKYDDEKGVWRTVSGRRIFIRSGESLGSAMARSGKFQGSKLSRVAKNKARDEFAKEDVKNKINNRQLSGRARDKKENKYIKRFESNVKHNEQNQAEKNRNNAEVHPLKQEYIGAKTRIEQNYPRYSKEDKRELKHEEVQKKLADYKAKKQSNHKLTTGDKLTFKENQKQIDSDKISKEYRKHLIKENQEILNKQSSNKLTKAEQHELNKLNSKISNHEVLPGEKEYDEANERIDQLLDKQSNKADPYNDPESEESQRLQSIQSRYDEYLQDTEGRGASYGEIAYVDSLRGKDLDDFEKELDDYETKKYNEEDVKSLERVVKRQKAKQKDENDWLPKATEIKEQGTSNRKEVSDNIQAHILEYYSPDYTGEDISPEDAFVRQMDAMKEPTMWKSGQRIAEGGSYLVYNGDMSDFLDSLKINPKGKKFSEDKAFQMYTSLIGRESAKLYDKIKKHQAETINKYKKRKGK